MFKFFGKTTTSNPELDALTKDMSERDKEKSEWDALTIATEFNTPESERETGKKRSVAEALRQEALRQTPLNPKKPKEADHGRDPMRELFGPDWEHPKEVQVPVGSLDPLIWPKELFASDPLILEATETQVPDPEIDGKELVLDDPPPWRSNREFEHTSSATGLAPPPPAANSSALR